MFSISFLGYGVCGCMELLSYVVKVYIVRCIVDLLMLGGWWGFGIVNGVLYVSF